MKKRFTYLLCIFVLSSDLLHAQKSKSWDLKSPDGNLSVRVEAGNKLQWSVQYKSQQIITPSGISLLLE